MNSLLKLRGAVFLAALMAPGCAIQFGGNRSRTDAVTNDDQAEFDVWTYMLQTVGTAQYKIVADSTIVRQTPLRSLCGALRQADCIPSSRQVIEAWEEFNRKRESRRLIPPLFPVELRVTMERDSHVEKTCRVPTIVSFSRVGFDRLHTRAIVTMMITTGKGPFPGCGGLSIMTVVLDKVGRSWKRSAYIESLET
ncbi:MAG TPA: hypothetical protein VM099_03305 [Gemmatimonadaceae bacterium]|nr:hypothetical protein [Gemmatimonadaceae bacterium]